MKLSIANITVDPEIQLEARQTDRTTVATYVEAMTNGDQFPPVVVYSDDDTNWLAGGFHRVAAAHFLGLAEIEAEVREGTKQDAMVFAALDNATHGRPMSNKEKKEAAERLFRLREDLSDREIARRLAVGNKTISRWHADFTEYVSNDTPYVAPQSPILFVAHAENMAQVEGESIDLIITSPPYNLGDDSWPMGGNGRTPREGIGYQDKLPEEEYQAWQVQCLIEMYRVAKSGASLFYNHKVRNQDGRIIHPMDWLRDPDNPWLIRQEIIWDRRSTHNHSAQIFWPEDERIYWMTKGKPTLPNRSVGMSTVWEFHGPRINTWHPAPFPEELPRRCMEAIGKDGITVLDPFCGSCPTLKVALEFGYQAVGVDVSEDYLIRACIENGWVEGISRGVTVEGPLQVSA